MIVYRFQKDPHNFNGGAFKKPSKDGFMYFAPSVDSAIMWGGAFLFLERIRNENVPLTGYIVEYEVEGGEAYERWLLPTKNKVFRELKVLKKTSTITYRGCRKIKYNLSNTTCMLEGRGETSYQIFAESYEHATREWKKISL